MFLANSTSSQTEKNNFVKTKKGMTLWFILKSETKKNYDDFNSLSKRQQNNVIANTIEKIKKKSSQYGIYNINKLKIGQSINVEKIFHNVKIDNLIEHSKKIIKEKSTSQIRIDSTKISEEKIDSSKIISKQIEKIDTIKTEEKFFPHKKEIKQDTIATILQTKIEEKKKIDSSQISEEKISPPQKNIFDETEILDEEKKETEITDSTQTKTPKKEKATFDSTKFANIEITTSPIIDSVAQGFFKDTTYVVENDSSERIKQWNFTKSQNQFANLFQKKLHPFLFSINHPAYSNNVALDSTENKIFVNEKWYNEDIRFPYSLSLDEYIRLRNEFEQRKLWKDSIHFYKFKNFGKDAIGSLFSTITNIDIPIPSNPIFSIFGPPKINLRVGGAIDIQAGFRSQKSDQVSINPREQQSTEPNFKQEVQVNVSGTIGDKLNLLADWNTQRTFEYENQLKLKYTGYDDEIVKSVEAGNVSMQAPRFFGSSQALFGIKSEMQLGPLKLYTLASQKKGQMKEVALTGGQTEKQFDFHPYDYATNHYFIDTIYRKEFETYFGSFGTFINNPNIQITDIEVWAMRTSGLPLPSDRKAIAIINLPPYFEGDTTYNFLRNSQQSISNGDTVTGKFYKLEKNSDYIFRDEGGFITLLRSLQNDQAIAVAYRTQNGYVYGDFVGSDTSQQSLTQNVVLKLVRPKNLLPSYAQAWKNQIKNIFNLGAKNLKEQGFELKIFYEKDEDKKESIAPLGEDIKLLSILGFDKKNIQGDEQPDGVFDFLPSVTVDQSRSEIIFPTLEPFGKTIANYFYPQTQQTSSDSELVEPFVYSFAYDSLLQKAREDLSHDIYVIKGKYTAEVSSKYSLGFNIVEGSVKATLAGVPLIAGVDYSVDYILGEIIIRREDALIPKADLKITYEQNDLFQLASKTLLGARAEIKPFSQLSFGATILNLNQETLSDKVRIGEEPTDNTMIGVDFTSIIEAPIVSDVLNFLPGFKTKETSEIKLLGEFAYMSPNPNTKKSTIKGEESQSIAYIDDFEGAQRTISLGTNFGQWSLASPPKISGMNDTSVVKHKAKLLWYTPPQGTVISDSIWPKRKTASGENFVTALDLRFFPKERGMYNYTKFPSTVLEKEKNWGGIMKTLGSSSNNLVEQNMSYIELWIKVFDNYDLSTGNLVIDLGEISEDVIPNDSLNSEDLVVYSIANGILNDGEDIGIDGITNTQEQNPEIIKNKLHQAFDVEVLNEDDPSSDNYHFTGIESNDYSKIDGTEGNQVRRRLPDSEDLNGNNFLDLANNYFTYKISLDTSDSFNPNPYIVGGGNDGWYQFRIPLTDYITTQGTPDLRNVQSMRLYLTGFQTSEDVLVRIVDFNIIGNQWIELARQDSIFRTSTVNLEDNPNYTIPPGVTREKDKSKPEQNIQLNEQSLALLINGMSDARNRFDSTRYQAVRYFQANKPLDLFNYKQMKLFVHAEKYNSLTDRGFRYFDSLNYDADVFIRFGSDTANFYEYRAPIHPAGNSITSESQWPSENNITIIFSELTSLKQTRDSAGVYKIIYKSANNGIPNAKYGVKGFPALNNIRYVGIGVTNPANNPSPERFPLDEDNTISGEIWVNELRVIGVENTPGKAIQFSAGIKLADLGSINFAYSKVDDYFHSLETRFGSRETNQDISVSANISLDKFFPTSWTGTSLPFNYSYAKREKQPRYFPNTDIQVASAVKRYEEEGLSADSVLTASQTFSESHMFSMPTIRFVLPTDAWYVDKTINRLSFSANYNKKFDRSPTSIKRNESGWMGKINYDLAFPTDLFFQPFKNIFNNVFILDSYKDYKIYFTPSKLQWSLDAKRDIVFDSSRTKSRSLLSSNFRANRSGGFGWKVSDGGFLNLNLNYGLIVESIPTHLEQDTITHKLYSFPTMLRKLFPKDKIIDFGRNSRYGQNISLNSKPILPNIYDIPKYFEFNAGYKVDYAWQSTFQGEKGQTAGWNSQSEVSLALKLKQLTDNIFSFGGSGKQTQTKKTETRGSGRGREAIKQKENNTQTDTTKISEKTEPETESSSIDFTETAMSVFKYAIKIPLLDYDNIAITFTQNKKSGNNGIRGENETGIANFWGFDNATLNGPSFLYQLGLSRNPSQFRAPKFLQDVWDTTATPDTILRVDTIKLQLTDDFSQSDKIGIRTSRNLWEGAKIDFTWQIGKNINENEVFTTGFDGIKIDTSSIFRRSGTIDRSFFVMPIPIFKPIKSYLKKVGELANRSKEGELSSETVTRAFEEGMETFSFLRFLGELPGVNYSIKWGGLEKITYFTGVFQSLGLEHSYSSMFTKTWATQQDGKQKTERAKITLNFQPLVGVNMVFAEMWKGNLNASFRYNSQTAYDLALTSNTIDETYTSEITSNIGFTKRGFNIPLFGLSLQNDIDFSFNFSYAANTQIVFDVFELANNSEGVPRGGSTRMQMEPRIKYILSSRVSLAVYYKYTSIKPSEGGSTIPGLTTNEAGIDLRIAIQ